MSIQNFRSSSKWNAIRSKSVPSNVTATSDTSLLNPRAGKSESEKRKGVLPAKLLRPPGYFRPYEPRSPSYE